MLLAAALALTLGVSSASADTSYSLNLGNTSGSPALSDFPPPYGTVNVHLDDSTHATITFTALPGPGTVQYLFGGGGAVAVNTNGAATIVAGFTGSNSGSGYSGTNLSNGGAGNEDGWGSFSNTLNEFDGYSWSLTTVTFQLAKSSGSWGSSADVLANNADGHLVAAHIFVSPTAAMATSGALATGFATNGPTLPGPEPATMALALAGIGTIGLGGVRRYLRRKA
jgi:hypothetical protein